MRIYFNHCNDLHFNLAENIASDEIEGFDDMDEEERAELVYYSMDDVELDIQDVDKVQFVNLAVEIIAQELAEERGDI